MENLFVDNLKLARVPIVKTIIQTKIMKVTPQSCLPTCWKRLTKPLMPGSNKATARLRHHENS